ncbi:hypothetical protein [Phormidium tenue]|uniref:Glycosyltransferase RgtA/B/C/D-like domain-containing protein n=1 Tax=Phormidium tenue FACHB-1050 TaxID=2692857 RepID=A0ABR8C3W9_9CYAN|nr:hypothetical protein [Phormidium tenue]MBD2315408.1 hypothetical protein [Phormidium tenue FACHB-1050]
MEKAQQNKLNNLYSYLLLFLFVSPSILWISLDQRVWPWDQAWYGQVSVELFYKLTHSPISWAKDMISAFGIKAPGTAWLGQLFVPIGNLIGSIEIGLLASTVLTQFCSLVLIYQIVSKLTSSRLITIICCLFAASSPLSVALTHQYLVEPLQYLSVTWIVLITVFSPDWQTKRTLLHLISAISLSMLAKITSPLYSFLAVLLILYNIWKNRNIDKNNKININNSKPQYINAISKSGFLALTAFVLASGFLLWYGKNLQTILSFTMLASSGEASLLYGEKADFFRKLQFWLPSFQKSFFSSTCLISTFVLLGYIAAKKVLKIKNKVRFYKPSYFDILAIVSLFQIVLVLCLFSLNVNQENRYLLPLLPYLVIILSWILKRTRQKLIVIFFALILTSQFFFVQSQALGLTLPNSDFSYWLYAFDRSISNKKLLADVVNTTCKQEGNERYNIIGLELTWFNANSASYYSSKQLLSPQEIHCYYTPLGYADKDIERAWKRLLDLKINFFITLKTELHPNDPFNQTSLPILERIQKSSQFTLYPSTDNDSVLLYKNITN